MSSLAPSDVLAALFLEAPLDTLLRASGARVVESSIDDPKFLGAAVSTKEQLLLTLSSGQPAIQRDAMARALLARAVGVGLPPLPPPFEMTEV